MTNRVKSRGIVKYSQFSLLHPAVKISIKIWQENSWNNTLSSRRHYCLVERIDNSQWNCHFHCLNLDLSNSPVREIICSYWSRFRKYQTVWKKYHTSLFIGNDPLQRAITGHFGLMKCLTWMEWIYILSDDRYGLKGRLVYMILSCWLCHVWSCMTLSCMICSVYTGITSHVWILPSPFIHENRKLQEGNIAVSLCIRKIASGIFRIS